jgi:hypothetical protein
VREAVLADQFITERQKEAMLQIYEAFVRETQITTRTEHSEN